MKHAQDANLIPNMENAEDASHEEVMPDDDSRKSNLFQLFISSDHVYRTQLLDWLQHAMAYGMARDQ